MPWGAPIGYCNNGAAKVKTPDPQKAPLVRQAFELYASGAHSIRSLAVEISKRGLRSGGGRPLSKASVEIMLANPFYCGLIHIKRTGQTCKGAHQPIITAALFQKVQDMKSGKTTKKVTRHNHLFRGLFQCEHCSRSLIGEWQKGRVYYRCQTAGCPTKTLREDGIECAMVHLLNQLALSESALAAAQERIPAFIVPDVPESEISNIKLQEAQVVRRLDRLTDMALDNLIESDAYQTKKQALMIEQQRLAEMRTQAERNEVNPNATQKFLELATSLAALYQSAAKPQKRRIVEWATSNRLASGKSVYFEPSKWLTATQNLLSVLSCADDRDDSRRVFNTLLDILGPLQLITQPEEQSD